MDKHGLQNFIKKRGWIIILVLAILYMVVFFGLSLWKYQNFKYDGLDLAIYNQVFFNSSNGQLFDFTIHPHSYLGDHFELFIIFLLPFYYVFKSPITLLFLQTLFLASCAWPLFLIAKNIFKKTWAGLLAGAWLLASPFIQNINSFEFHLLPFALFIIFWAFYFFQKNNYIGFLIASFFALTVREDVALIIIGIGLLAFFCKGKEKIKWAVIPIVLGVAWFFISLKLTGMYSGYDQYKFLAYYSWLGDTPLEFIKNLIIRPDLVFPYLFSTKNINIVIIFLISFAFLPLFRIKYMLPSIIIWIQYFFSVSGNEIIYRTHYSTLLLPFLFISSLYGLKRIIDNKGKISRFIKRNHVIFAPVFIAIVLYSLFTLGPIIPYVRGMVSQPAVRAMEREIKNNLISKIPDNASVIATYDLLPKLSSRRKVYSLYYTFTGYKQLSEEKYITPDNITHALLDFDDLIEYQVQMQNLGHDERYTHGDDNLREFIKNGNFKIIDLQDSLALLQADAEGQNFYETMSSLPKDIALNPTTINQKINLLAKQVKIDGQKINVSLYFQALKNLEKNYQLQLTLERDGEEKYSAIYPLAYGIYPTTEWLEEEIIKMDYKFVIPDRFDLTEHSAKLNIIDITSGNLAIINVNSIEVTNLKIDKLEPAIDLN